ncbi:MAG: glycosyltransferase family 4 protein [Isosphaeraceae bacterium]
MREENPIRKLAIIGNDIPRQCGIATFTHDMYASLASAYPDVDVSVVAVNDRDGGYAYGPEVRFEFDEGDLDGYLRAAEFLNFQCPDVVNVQHEFGIYGGAAGWYINALVRELQAPVVTTLHTVLKTPNHDQLRSLKRLCDLSTKLVVMSETGKRLLRESCRVPESKIEVIAHGIPDMPFTDPSYFKDRFKAEGKLVLLTFGLLAPNKGIEYMIQALPRVVAEFPELVYLVVGATHPNLIRDNGESYRESLQRLARDLGVEKNVEFANKFVDREELLEYIGASDLYVTPYLNPAQITSGTLAYSFGCGKAVISTPYWHAEELLADGRGVIVPFADPDALSNEIVALLKDEPRRQAMRKRAYMMGREMIWSQSARNYMDVFLRARSSLSERPAAVGRTRTRFPGDLPEWRFDHLQRLSDSTGMIQHAVFTLPNYSEGYCTDDNARALMLAALLEDQGVGEELNGLADRYAAFLEHAFNPEHGRFRNFLGFDRRWLEDVGSEDSHGRALWALGTCVGRSQRKGLQQWAAPTFEKALGASLEMTAPRTWAFNLLGLHEYLRRLRGARRPALARDVLVGRLVRIYDETAAADWPWFENKLSYDNARLSQALIVAGRECADPRALEIGLTSLRWLTTLQKGAAGHFRAIGSNGFYTRGEEPARFDQQPLEASATVSACLSAYAVTDDRTWLTEALTAFEWFLGRNDLNLPLYDPATGGCRDGLEPDRVNQNQGAESTLAFLLALAELKAIYQPYGGPGGAAERVDSAARAVGKSFPTGEMLH